MNGHGFSIDFERGKKCQKHFTIGFSNADMNEDCGVIQCGRMFIRTTLTDEIATNNEDKVLNERLFAFADAT